MKLEKARHDAKLLESASSALETVPAKDDKNTDLVCALWEDSMDAWWQMHPDYELTASGENDTHTCFRPIANPQKVEFYRQIYQNQYHGEGCHNVRARFIISVGYAAHTNWVAFGLYDSFLQGLPFSTKHYREGYRWMYAPKYYNVSEEERSWAACPDEDHNCYFLPISNCHPPVSNADLRVRVAKIKQSWPDHPELLEQFIWTQQYLQRPNQLTRKHLRELIKEEAPVMGDGPCTWIHVRRGDATSEKFARNFYPLNEYLERGNVSTSDNILLLTDDETAIDEANLLYPQYKWHYWKRTRVRGAAKTIDNHIPSHDEAHELLVILGELELAGKCQKGVHGTSNMVEMFKMAMVNNYGLEDIQLTQIDEELKHEEGDAKQFVKDLEVKLEEARKKQQQA